MAVLAEVHPEAGGARVPTLGERRQKLVPKRGTDRRLERRSDPQRRQN